MTNKTSENFEAIEKIQKKLKDIKEKMKENPFNAIDPDNPLKGFGDYLNTKTENNPNLFFTDHDKTKKNNPLSKITPKNLPAAAVEKNNSSLNTDGDKTQNNKKFQY